MAGNSGTPKLSVVVVTPDEYGTIRETMHHLRAQTLAVQLEIIIVAPSQEARQPDDGAIEVFQAVRVIEVGVLESSAAARAAGAQVAAAPVIAFIEDHSCPEPEWAEALIEAHRRPRVAVVGPSLRNANPATLISWANIVIEYSPWLEPSEPRYVEHLPGHNSSYKRAILTALGDDKVIDRDGIPPRETSFKAR